MKLGVFVSGTDTGIGKTLVSSLLVSSLKSFGIRAGYFKPVQTGSESDSQTVMELSGISESCVPSPTYQFEKPQSPNRAAEGEGKQIQIDAILDDWKKLEDRAWVIEGAGGLLVPLNAKQTVRDLVSALGVKLVLVSSTRLGTINHTLLSIEAAKNAGITVAGIVLVGKEDPGLSSVLTEFSGVPVLAQIPLFPEVSSVLIQEKCVSYFPVPILKELYE